MAKKPKKNSAPKYRDRIVGLERVKASDLKPCPSNWRRHPEAQRGVLEAMLGDVGVANAVLAWRNEDGELELLDGHLRRDTLHDQDIPVLVLDVNRKEAEALLLTMDPLAAMAVTDEEKLADLRQRLRTRSEAVRAMLEELPKHKPLVPPRKPLPKVDAETGEVDPVAYGGATAIGRSSGPIAKWRELELLKGDVLDFGCGRERHEFEKYDPFHAPNVVNLCRSWDVVMCNYVLNVQPADHLITQVAALVRVLLKPGGLALFAMRSDMKESAESERGFQNIKSPDQWADMLAPFFTLEPVPGSGFIGFKASPRADGDRAGEFNL